MNKNISVIGGGPAGMAAAYFAAASGAKVRIFEHSGMLGKKLMITGKGRCNLTNDCEFDRLLENVRNNPKFLFAAFRAFDNKDLMEFFESSGVPLKTERGGRVFPVSDRSSDIVEAMKGALKRVGVEVIFTEVTELLIKRGRVEAVLSADGKFESDAVIVATGGLSYPKTGSTGDGYRFAKLAGHKVEKPYASLVPLECAQFYCAELMGLTLKNIAVSFFENDRLFFKDFGEMIFTHFGVSGPVILSASAHIKEDKKKNIKLLIDLKPALSFDQLDARLLRDFEYFCNRDFKNSLAKLLPSAMIPVVVALSGIDPEKKVNAVTKTERRAVVSLIKAFPLRVTGKRPIAEAIVTGGGVCCNEINSSTMESKLAKGLFFAGEVIDVDAYTGGYNLQIAFSTGALAGRSAAKEG